MKTRREITEQLEDETRKLGIGKLPKFFQNRFLNALVVMYEDGIKECLHSIEGTDAWYHAKEEYDKGWQLSNALPVARKGN